jgi:hypothetical protein
MDKCTKEFDAWESEFRASFGGGSSIPGFGMQGIGDRITAEGRERMRMCGGAVAAIRAVTLDWGA